MKRKLTQLSYTIDVDLTKIIDIDNELENDNRWDDTLIMQLDKIIGCYDIDYNNHFGNFIFITIEAKYDTPEKWEEIETTIKKFLEK